MTWLDFFIYALVVLFAMIVMYAVFEFVAQRKLELLREWVDDQSKIDQDVHAGTYKRVHKAFEVLTATVNENATRQNAMADAIGYLQEKDTALWNRLTEHEAHGTKLRETNARVERLRQEALSAGDNAGHAQGAIQELKRQFDAACARGNEKSQRLAQLEAHVTQLAASNNALVEAVELLAEAMKQRPTPKAAKATAKRGRKA